MSRNIANVRIHVERVIGCVRQRFRILSATGVLPKELCYKKDGIVMLDAIVRVCCALNNMSKHVARKLSRAVLLRKKVDLLTPLVLKQLKIYNCMVYAYSPHS